MKRFEILDLPIQNIPIRSALGREIRRGFESPSMIFASVDYTAIEERWINQNEIRR